MPSRAKKKADAAVPAQSSSNPFHLRIRWNTPAEFHNQQFGRHHGFQVEVELRRKPSNAIVKDIVMDLKPSVYYAKEGGATPKEVDKVKDQGIIVFLQRQPPRVQDGSATFKLRIKEVSKNHMKRKFQIKLEQVGKARMMSSSAAARSSRCECRKGACLVGCEGEGERRSFALYSYPGPLAKFWLLSPLL